MNNRPGKTSRAKNLFFFGSLSLAGVVLGLTLLSLRGVDILGLVAAATSSLTKAPATLYFMTYEDTDFSVGDSRKIDVDINARVAVNAIGATITFPVDSMEVLGFNKERSFFDLWTEETAIDEEKGEVHFSGGTTRSGGLTGTGTVLTLIVRAKERGTSELKFSSHEVYADDGDGTLLDTDARALAFDIKEFTRSNAFAPIVDSSREPDRPLPHSADVNQDGVVNLVDVSILLLRILSPYDQRFDLTMDGSITIADLSVVLANIK